MIRIVLLALVLPLIAAQTSDTPNFTFRCNPCRRTSFPVGQRKCVISKEAAIFVDHPTIQDTTCQDIWVGVNSFIFNPEQCAAIQATTFSPSDPCGCVDANTDEFCEAPDDTSSQSCNICKGFGNAIGDGNKIIFGGTWSGNPCTNLFDLQNEFDFSTGLCEEAQDAAQAHCQCYDDTNPDEINALIQCHEQENGDDPCLIDNPKSICCIGECRFRLSEGDNVCTGKPAETPPPGYKLPSLTGSGIGNFQWGDLASPVICGEGGDTCVEEADCCGSMKCARGSLGLVCAGGGVGINKPSAAGGGGAGGGSRGGAGGNARKRRNLKQRPTLKKGGLRRIDH